MKPAENTGQYAASVAKIMNSPPTQTGLGTAAMALICFMLEFKLQLVPGLSFFVALEQGLNSNSHRHRRLDGRIRVVADDFKILVFEIVNVLHRRIQFNLRQWARLARQLQLSLLDVICVKMQVTERVDEIARFQSADLRDHQREQRVAGDVEGHAEKNIRAALIELAAQLALAHIKVDRKRVV